MVELIILLKLTRSNANHAIARGRGPSTAKVYTVVLWFLFEFLGLFIGTAVCSALDWPIKLTYLYLFAALPMAILGGFISTRIAKRGETFYTPPQ